MMLCLFFCMHDNFNWGNMSRTWPRKFLHTNDFRQIIAVMTAMWTSAIIFMAEPLLN